MLNAIEIAGIGLQSFQSEPVIDRTLRFVSLLIKLVGAAAVIHRIGGGARRAPAQGHAIRRCHLQINRAITGDLTLKVNQCIPACRGDSQQGKYANYEFYDASWLFQRSNITNR